MFHRYAIVDNQDIAHAMDVLEKSQDQQRQDLEQALAAKSGHERDVHPSSPPVSSRRK